MPSPKATQGYIQEITGLALIPFIYLGAKHMVTGYDHILFLFGVIFFLYRMKDIALYVSIFAVGHSVTMIAGVWFASGSTPTSSTRSSAFRSSTRRSTTLGPSGSGSGSSRTPRPRR